MKSRAAQVTFLALMLISACNKEDYYGKSLEIEGLDAVCASGTDTDSCNAIAGCQAAFEDVESVTPVFASCIADPPPVSEVTPPPAPVVQPPVVVNEPAEPTIQEAYASKCEELDDKYLLIKNYSGEGPSKRVKKVKLCHQTSNSEHAIIVACPALKAHLKHDDYLGACKAD